MSSACNSRTSGSLELLPEFAVQILAAARMARAVLETGRIANRIKRQIITGGQFGLGFQQFDELDDRVHAFRFVAVDAGENADADRRVAALGPDEQIARQFVGLAASLKTRLVVRHQVRRVGGDLFQRREQVGDGTPARRRRLSGDFGWSISDGHNVRFGDSFCEWRRLWRAAALCGGTTNRFHGWKIWSKTPPSAKWVFCAFCPAAEFLVHRDQFQLGEIGRHISPRPGSDCADGKNFPPAISWPSSE